MQKQRSQQIRISSHKKSPNRGEITFDDVKPGKYIVESSQETFNPKQSEEFSIIPGDEITVEITLDAALE